MPGPYAHLTLVHVLRARLARGDFAALSAEAQDAVALATAYCDLGAIAPDCSYFAVAQPAHQEWGDLIHHGRAMRVVATAARVVREETDPRRRRHGLAWALGFASHLVADAVVHPVVNAIAGDYDASAENQRLHAQCEIHQDTHIYRRLGLHEIGRADVVRALAAGCSGEGGLDPWIAWLWGRCLLEVYVREAPREPPDPGQWFRAFCALVDVADEGHHFGFLRRQLSQRGKMYIVPGEVERRFVASLSTPVGVQDYEAVFERAVQQTGKMWIAVGRAVAGDSAGLMGWPEFDLDTGVADGGEVPLFWS